MNASIKTGFPVGQKQRVLLKNGGWSIINSGLTYLLATRPRNDTPLKSQVISNIPSGRIGGQVNIYMVYY